MLIKSNTIGKLQKIRNGNVFDSPLIFIRELLQNSQRSKSKNVDFLIDGDVLTCKDDGCGCSNPENVFTLDLSEWESTTEGYGIGFWSCLAVPRIGDIIVSSKDWCCSFNAQKLYETGDLSVKKEKASVEKGFEVKLKSDWFAENYDYIESYLFDIAKYLPMTVTINELQVPHYDIFDSYEESNFCKEYDNRMFHAKFEITHDYYGETKLYYEKRLVGDFSCGGFVSGVIESKNGKLTLKEPDRTSFAKDEKYQVFIRKIYDCIRDLYKSYILTYGIEDDYFEDGIAYWLNLKDYEKYLDFDDDMLQKAEKAEKDVKQPVTEKVAAISIETVNTDDFKQPDKITNQTFVVSANTVSRTRDNKSRSFKEKVKNMRRSVWVEKSEYTNYSEEIQEAKYKGLNVIIAKNKLYIEALINYGITHISSLKDCFIETYIKKDIELKNGKEEAFISLLQPICKKYGLAPDTFLMANLSIESSFVVDGDVVLKRNMKNRKNNIQIYGVTDHRHIYLDRNAMGLHRFSLKKENQNVGIWELKALFANIDTIAHELAHFLFYTKDNTVEHFQTEIRLQQEIAALYV